MKNLVENKIAIVGGHLTPALAVLEELERRKYDSIIWVGSKYSQTGNKNTSPEYQLIKNLNIKFIELKAGKLWRKYTLKTIIPGIYNLVLIPLGFIKSLIIVLIYQPDLILSFGGYLALPMVIAAKVFRKKIITHEQTIVTGTTNKIIAKFADIVLISWEQSKRYFPPKKTILVGLPLRGNILANKNSNRVFNNDLPVVFVVGGNQGSNTINWRLLEILPYILEHANIIHLTGNSTITHDFEKAKQAQASLSPIYRDRYIVNDHLFGSESRYSSYINQCDIILSRSGANTIAEILTLGKLAVLIPIPWTSHNEQHLNAQMVKDSGLGYILNQTLDLQPADLKNALIKALEAHSKKVDFNGRDINASRAQAMNLIDTLASQKFVDQVESLLAR